MYHDRPIEAQFFSFQYGDDKDPWIDLTLCAHASQSFTIFSMSESILGQYTNGEQAV